MNRTQGIELAYVSDADEPEVAILAGMEHSQFDGVMLALVPDGEQGEHGWYDTPDTKDGRPTRPILIFQRGFINARAHRIEYVSERLDEPIADIVVVAEWDRGEFSVDSSDNRRTLEVHLTYPPYPWFEAAVIGMQMGQHFNELELVSYTEPSDSYPAKYTYSFHHSVCGESDV